MNKFYAMVLTAGMVMCAYGDEKQERVISGFRVDLRPLATWWDDWNPKANADQRSAAISMRPLKSWARIIGKKTGENIYGWIVRANIQEFPGQKGETDIMLLHPPISQKARFDELKEIVARLQRQRENLENTASFNLQNARDDRHGAGQLANVGASSDFMHYQVADRQPSLNNSARTAEARANYFYRKSGAASAELESAREELNAMPSSDGEYKIDFFAIKMAQPYKGMPVYDMGQ